LTTNRRTIAASPQQVWDVLSDGWLYPLWVVGASRVREVDDTWPSPGSKIRHSVGAWPALLDDETVVLECQAARYLRLQARAWPVGEAHVEITLHPSGAQTDLVIEEDVVNGPSALVPRSMRALPIKWRNTETLRRLAFICEGRSRDPGVVR
jgi:hypothetical protein